jgi:hypothetical protein
VETRAAAGCVVRLDRMIGKYCLVLDGDGNLLAPMPGITPPD